MSSSCRRRRVASRRPDVSHVSTARKTRHTRISDRVLFISVGERARARLTVSICHSVGDFVSAVNLRPASLSPRYIRCEFNRNIESIFTKIASRGNNRLSRRGHQGEVRFPQERSRVSLTGRRVVKAGYKTMKSNRAHGKRAKPLGRESPPTRNGRPNVAGTTR